MKKFLGALLTGFAVFFSIPTVLILASWNAIPGDTLYSVKSSLEDVALALTANTPIATAFSVNFTDRRFNEAAILLDKKGSTVGYQLLVAEANQSRSMILSKRDSKNGTQLVRKIEEYQADIEAKQAVAQNLADSSPNTYHNPTPAPYLEPESTADETSDEKKTITLTTTVEVVIEEEEDEDVIENLELILDELEEIKVEIEDELPAMAAEEASSEPDSWVEVEEMPEENNTTTVEEAINDNNKDKDKDTGKPPKYDEDNLDE